MTSIKKKKKRYYKKERASWVPVTQNICNPSYSGGRDQEEASLGK
jgi:hypothetical protein